MNPAGAQIQSSSGGTIDPESGLWLEDSDGDGYPDVTERSAGTDPRASASVPVDNLNWAQTEAAIDEANLADGFAFSECQSGFLKIGDRLCVEPQAQNAARYDDASLLCRQFRSRVCNYEDFYYIFSTHPTPATWGATGRWIGQFVGDDTVMIINTTVSSPLDEDRYNFDGTAGRSGSRNFFCCHDRLGLSLQARCPRLDP